MMRERIMHLSAMRWSGTASERTPTKEIRAPQS